ncbi:MAG TPA: hypothetical protein VIK20_01130 [Bacteroidales bacterium]
METNQFFSLKRFYLLLRNDVLINYKMYLFTIIVAFLVDFVVIYMQLPKGYHPDPNYSNFAFITSFFICLFSLGLFLGMSFPNMDNKIKVRSYLLMPSSTFEKFLSQFLIRIVVGTILFMMIFWIDTRLVRLVILGIYKGAVITDINLFHFASLYKNQNGENTLLTNAALTLFFVSIGTFIFSVRLFFKKNSFLKTAISTFGVLYLIFCLMVILSHCFFPSTFGFDVHTNGHLILHSKINIFDFWIFSVMSLSWLFFLPTGYFKLKEKQV